MKKYNKYTHSLMKKTNKPKSRAKIIFPDGLDNLLQVYDKTFL